MKVGDKMLHLNTHHNIIKVKVLDINGSIIEVVSDDGPIKMYYTTPLYMDEGYAGAKWKMLIPYNKASIVLKNKAAKLKEQQEKLYNEWGGVMRTLFLISEDEDE